MLMTLVLTRSYAGNLMSLLAVRHISQPYQTLHDVVEDSAAIMIWKAKTIYVNIFRSSNSGIFHEVGDLEDKGRVILKSHKELPSVLDTLVRRGDHIILDVDVSIFNLMSQDFSRTGRCDFYKSRASYFFFIYSLALQKNSPLTPGMSKRIMDLTEHGLYLYWSRYSGPNSTNCEFPPTKITINSSLSTSNLWGMFVVLVGGHVTGLLVLLMEIFSVHLKSHRHWCT
ncbi:putative olfactory ionotropic receptor IR7-like 2 [Homarus americanus]|uniref:Putative olfactory ionotropic receptor IR7-like 2 n=2 Tax=Homarus americanus TaxID=6706 RepID=A0A8J5JV00_HOMAM|nr:putative olfactory ionotropic receptor IR7-like 2 [Homarus americanus]